jgi:Mor family transcriptional regulator
VVKYLPARAPEFLRDVVDVAAAVLAAKAGIDDAAAIEIGQEIALRVAQIYRGSKVFIPSGTWNRGSLNCFELSKRDLAIFRDFNGRNRAEVMAKYGIAKSRLYAIVNAVRKRLKTTPET